MEPQVEILPTSTQTVKEGQTKEQLAETLRTHLGVKEDEINDHTDFITLKYNEAKTVVDVVELQRQETFSRIEIERQETFSKINNESIESEIDNLRILGGM